MFLYAFDKIQMIDMGSYWSVVVVLFTGACAVVEEVMLQEAFDLSSTQTLSFYAIAGYLATKPTLSVRRPLM